MPTPFATSSQTHRLEIASSDPGILCGGQHNLVMLREGNLQ
jgi:hypothetical protein